VIDYDFTNLLFQSYSFKMQVFIITHKFTNYCLYAGPIFKPPAEYTRNLSSLLTVRVGVACDWFAVLRSKPRMKGKGREGLV